ncbi:MAG: PTS IIA-like nitrogen regulatory protein PtsN [Gammaproteobacteria bacterium]
MQISEILSAERILCNVETASKKSALEELAKLIANADPSLTYTEIFTCLFAREKLGSTGLGNGIAIPHGRLQHCTKTIAAFLQLREGINYDATDQKPVDLIFALLVPENSTDEHLQILSKLAEMFSDNSLLARLRVESNPERIIKILTA